MENIKINETPIRTSRNFNINNIKLENINVPENIEKFNGFKLTGGSSKIKIEHNPSKIDLTYGIDNFLVNQVEKKANKSLKITVDGKIQDTFEINYEFDNSNPVLLDNIEIIANEETNANIVLKYKSKSNIENFHNGVMRVLAKKNSYINIVIVNLMNSISNNFISIENVLEEKSKVNYTIIDFGGKNSIINYYSNIKGKESENNLNTIYLGKDNQLFDLNYIGELRGEKSNINIEVQGALKDNAKKHFKGTIDFKKGCKKATGNENEACMLLSDTAKSLALPMLLCSEEDVEGNHSSSAGKVGEKELFYIMSRGFTLKEAMKLMVKARFNKILENIKNEELKQEIIEEIERRLD